MFVDEIALFIKCWLCIELTVKSARVFENDDVEPYPGLARLHLSLDHHLIDPLDFSPVVLLHLDVLIHVEAGVVLAQGA